MNHMIREGYCLIKPDVKEKQQSSGFVLPEDNSTIQAEGTLVLNGASEDLFPLGKKVLYNITRAVELKVDGEKFHLVDEKFVFMALNVLETKDEQEIK